MSENVDKVHVVDVAVVGAGISGLVAAMTIQKQAPNATFVVLEAAPDRVGGRIHTGPDGTELGAAFFGPTQNRMLNLIHDLGLSTYEIDGTGKDIFSIDGAVRRYDADAKAFDGNPIARADCHAALQRLEADAARVDGANPQKECAGAAPLDVYELDRVPLARYLRGLCRTSEAYQFLYLNFQALLTHDPECLSALCGLWYVKNCGGFSAVLEGETWKTKEGNSRIVERLAERIGGAKVVKLGCAVRTVDTTGRADRPVRLTGDGFAPIEAKRVVFAIPPNQLGRVRFDPPLPPERVQELQRWAMGHVIKTFTTYDAGRLWKEKGLSGRVLARVTSQARGGAGACPSIDIYDDSGPTGDGAPAATPIVTGSGAGKGTLLAFIDASYANHWVKKTEEERKAALAQHFAKLFGDDRLLHPSGYQERLWSAEPWIGGCFFASPMPGVLSDFGRGWCAPWAAGLPHMASAEPRVFFASTEAANHWFGYMEGGYEAGERAAYDALVSLGLLPKGTLPPPPPVAPKGFAPAPQSCFDPKVAAQAKPQLVAKL